MGNRSGLLGLVRGMRAYVADTSVVPASFGTPSIVVGWAKRWRQDNQGAGGASRIVLIPGQFDASAPWPPKTLRAGSIDRDFEQNYVQLNPQMRIRAMWHQQVTCCVWGVDPSNPTDEEAQIAATEDLLELTIQALHNAVDSETGQTAGAANIAEYGEPSWTLPPGENGFGRELSFGFVLLVPLFEQPTSEAFPRGAVARLPAA